MCDTPLRMQSMEREQKSFWEFQTETEVMAHGFYTTPQTMRALLANLGRNRGNLSERGASNFSVLICSQGGGVSAHEIRSPAPPPEKPGAALPPVSGGSRTATMRATARTIASATATVGRSFDEREVRYTLEVTGRQRRRLCEGSSKPMHVRAICGGAVRITHSTHVQRDARSWASATDKLRRPGTRKCTPPSLSGHDVEPTWSKRSCASARKCWNMAARLALLPTRDTPDRCLWPGVQQQRREAAAGCKHRRSGLERSFQNAARHGLWTL